MSTATQPSAPDAIEYPEDNGEPLAENTLQYEWIVTIKGGLDAVFRHRPDVFVAADLLWYPVQGNTKLCTAPDAMVAFGRPRGRRNSYLQWNEGGIAPQVVFEVLSPGNRPDRMSEKFLFYQTYGVQEYYTYDPDSAELAGWRRLGRKLVPIKKMDGWTSPLLNVRFELASGELKLYGPDGQAFATYLEIVERADDATAQAEAEKYRADDATAQVEVEKKRADNEKKRADDAAAQVEAEKKRADNEKERADAERALTERLLSKLRELGVEPE